jgi:hypothetical protein
MKIPNHLYLGRHKIKIHKVKPVAESYIGRFNTRSFDIYLNQNYCQSVQEEAFVHELIHAIGVLYALGLNEHQVSVLAEQVYSTISPMLEGKNVRKSTQE